MTANSTMTHLAAAALGAVVLVTAVPAIGFAQQLDKAARTAKSDRGGATRPVKPAQRAAATQNSRKTETPGRQWVLEDALPDHSAAMRYYAPEPAKAPAVGRVPLRSGPGTFGLATETKTRSDLLPDGRPIPSLETSSQKNPSYLGLSLSVPTSDKALNIPVPFGAPW